MTDDNKLNLPSPILCKDKNRKEEEGPEVEVTLEALEDIKRGATIDQVLDQDLLMVNNNLRALQFCFMKAESIATVCKLVDTSMNVLERRRKLMGLPYGTESKTLNGGTWEPLP